MKYLGLVEIGEDLISKEYVDEKFSNHQTHLEELDKKIGSFDDFLADIGKKGNFVTKDYVDKSKIDDDRYIRFNAINLIFSMMALSKVLSVRVSSLTVVCKDMYIKNSSNFVKVHKKYKCSDKRDVLKLIKNEKYLYIPNSEFNQFFVMLEERMFDTSW